jgi:hypothetical protein
MISRSDGAHRREHRMSVAARSVSALKFGSVKLPSSLSTT